MWPAFESDLSRYQELERQLSDPAVIADRSRYASLAREHCALARRVTPYLEFREVAGAIAQAEELLAAEKDPDMRRYAEEELGALRGRRDALQSRLEDFLLEDPAEEFDSVILEIRAGTGGDEAALFVGD